MSDRRSGPAFVTQASSHQFLTFFQTCCTRSPGVSTGFACSPVPEISEPARSTFVCER